MPQHTQLNFANHHKLKVKTERSADLGDGVMTAHTFPWEFADVQAEYPILFYKNPDRESYSALALLGFEQGENLFLANQQWQANYIPAAMRMPPFLIGYSSLQDKQANVGSKVHIDLDHPRVCEIEGEPLFNEDGSSTEFLQQQTELLAAVHLGFKMIQEFTDQLEHLELLESLNLDIELNNGSKNRLVGFHTINEDRLQELKGADLESLHAKGYLKLIYLMIGSLPKIQDLIVKKNLIATQASA